MARSVFNSGDSTWAILFGAAGVLNTIKTDTRLSARQRAQLTADHAVCLANAASSGATPDIQGRFLAAVRTLFNKKQA